MPKGSGRPFNKPERELAESGAKTRGVLGMGERSIANVDNEHRDNVRSARSTIAKTIDKVGLGPYIRTGAEKETKVSTPTKIQVTPGKWKTGGMNGK
jgi:hypothetical protein